MGIGAARADKMAERELWGRAGANADADEGSARVSLSTPQCFTRDNRCSLGKFLRSNGAILWQVALAASMAKDALVILPPSPEVSRGNEKDEACDHFPLSRTDSDISCITTGRRNDAKLYALLLFWLKLALEIFPLYSWGPAWSSPCRSMREHVCCDGGF